MKRDFVVMANPIDSVENHVIDTFDTPGAAEILSTELAALGILSWVDEVIDPDSLDDTDHNNLVTEMIGAAMGDMTIVPGGRAWDRNDILIRKPDEETHRVVYGADTPYTPTAYAVMTLNKTRDRYVWRLTHNGIRFLTENSLVSRPVSDALHALLDLAKARN